MNKNIVGIGLAAVAIIGIGGVVAANMPDKKDESSAPSSQTSNHNNTDKKDDSKSNSGAEQDLTSQTQVTMDIKDFAFAQKSIKIKKGTKVTWTNQDDAKHNVFSEDDGGPKGKLLAMGETFEFTFDKVGTVNYICEPHPYMKGIVNVVE